MVVHGRATCNAQERNTRFVEFLLNKSSFSFHNKSNSVARQRFLYTLHAYTNQIADPLNFLKLNYNFSYLKKYHNTNMCNDYTCCMYVSQ